MERKSNVDIDNYQILAVDRLYGLESIGRKDIEICKNYEEIETKTKSYYQWDGTYTICYDGVTDLYCYINIKDQNLCIEFIEGESIHGSSSPYPLHKDYDKETIESIISKVLKDDDFIVVCKLNCDNSSEDIKADIEPANNGMTLG